MSGVQRFFKWVMPRKWFAAAESESRKWMIRCPCGAERSVWDAGGIRWKAAGKTRMLGRCLACGQRTWHTLARIEPKA